eukprot:1120949-Rhodomonas_salina.3
MSGVPRSCRDRPERGEARAAAAGSTFAIVLRPRYSKSAYVLRTRYDVSDTDVGMLPLGPESRNACGPVAQRDQAPAGEPLFMVAALLQRCGLFRAVYLLTFCLAATAAAAAAVSPEPKPAPEPTPTGAVSAMYAQRNRILERRQTPRRVSRQEPDDFGE